MSPAKHPHRNSRLALSRRACVSALAAAAVAPKALRAETLIPWHTIDIWKPYRREDLGFEVEFPGDPEIEEEKDEDGASVIASFLFVGMLLAIEHATFQRGTSIEAVARQQRKATEDHQGRITQESSFVMQGFPALEIVSKDDEDFVVIMRAVVMGDRMIAVQVIGGPDIADNPSALRFLKSFRLLPLSP